MRSRSLLGALVGVLTAAVAVGVGEVVAAFVRPSASPLIAVGRKVIDLTPGSTERSATSTFGTNDKAVLIGAILVLLVAFGVVIGRLAMLRLRYGLAGIAVLALFAGYCAATAPAGRAGDVVPTVIGAVAAAAVMTWLVHTLRREDDDAAPAEPALTERRSFLQGGLASAALAAAAGFGGRALQHARFDVGAERRRIALPSPVGSVQQVPRGADLGKTQYPWATPSDAFYRIDTALSVPQIRTQDWSLRIHGMVDHEIEISYAELLKRPMIERWVTLCCVSNEVGGHLVGNAQWQGVRLADLLREAGVQDGCDQLVMSSSDGMTIGAPTKVVMDGRDALVAVGMNGEPLPLEHGFPARIVVPGLYGYVSACKWVVDIEATTFARDRTFWVQRGWAQQTDIKLESRIDTPQTGRTLAVGRPTAVAGVAWDQHVGVSAVEVQVNDGPWQAARLATVPSTDTWRQWVFAWTPPAAGTYRLRVRATDAEGNRQTEEVASVYPSGATGLHTITVQAR